MNLTNKLNNSKMVLYFAVTNYHILSSLLHKLVYHRKDKAVLLIPNQHTDFYQLQKQISLSRIFDKVVGFNEPYIPRKAGDITNQEINEAIDARIKFIEQDFPVDLWDFEKLYVYADHYAFGVYLVKKHIPYFSFEDGVGRLSKNSLAKDYIRYFDPVLAEIMIKLKLGGENEYVLARFGDLKKQSRGYQNPKDIHFSAEEELEKLSVEERNKIIEIYGKDKIHLGRNPAALLLTQHFINLGMMSFDEQSAIYSLMIDYFCPDMDLYIKVHPSDVQGLYSQWFPQARIINRSIPSELIKYLVNRKFDLGLAASSTSILNMGGSLNQSICLNPEFEKTYKSMNRYYMALAFIKKIINRDDRHIYTAGVNITQLKYLAQIVKVDLPRIVEINRYPASKEGRKIVLIDDVLKSKGLREKYLNYYKSMGRKDVIIYFNSEEMSLFYDEKSQSLQKDVLPLTIRKENLVSSSLHHQLEDEIMHIITSDNKIKLILKAMKESRKLKNSGIKISVDQSKDFEIKFLQASLKAAEARNIELAEGYLALTKANKRLRSEMVYKVKRNLVFLVKTIFSPESLSKKWSIISLKANSVKRRYFNR